MNPSRPIVVLTPVKDEAWILPLFLHAVSQVADHILVLDQGSTDESREICRSHPKVVVQDNPSPVYSERERTELLLKHARSNWGAHSVLLALDADEIPAADCLASPEWQTIRRLPAGSCIYVDKPDLLGDPRRCVRGAPFPLGYVDDGATLEGGEIIHSRRVPYRTMSPRYYASTLVILHLARIRMREYAARQAMYCLVENGNRTKSLRVRLQYYAPWAFQKMARSPAEPVPATWYAAYEQAGFPLWSFTTERFNSFHLRCLRLMAEHGCRRFWLDDVWWEDWSAARDAFARAGEQGLPQSVERPPFLIFLAGKILSTLVRWQVSVCAWLRHILLGWAPRFPI